MANYKRHKPKTHIFGQWLDELYRASGNGRDKVPHRDLIQPQMYTFSSPKRHPWRYRSIIDE